MLSNFSIIIPEIIMIFLALSQQLIILYFSNLSKIIIKITLFFMILISLFLIYPFSQLEYISFNQSFATSRTIAIFKSSILIFSIISILVYINIKESKKNIIKHEFITLIIFSALGLFISISARDFLLLFCGLELQSLSSYALTAFSVNKIKSSEAGIKYFILGILISGIFLFAVSLLYGYSGSITFSDIYEYSSKQNSNLVIIVAVMIVVFVLLFKIAAAPLHVWLPDVYEGSPIAAVVFFSTSSKIAMFVVLINLINYAIGNLQYIYTLLKIFAILSMCIGTLGAINQSSLKRFWAYATIANIGYMLIGLSLKSHQGQISTYIYLFIYLIGTITFFLCLIILFSHHIDEVTFDDLQGIAFKYKNLSIIIVITMFSMIGIPPLAGFISKYYILYHTLKCGEVILAIIALLTTVISAFYYLKIVKYMYFMEINPKTIITNQKNMLFRIIVTFNTIFILFLFIVISLFPNIIRDL